MDDTCISSESFLVTPDVISLYTNIPHQEGLDAYRETVNKREVLDPLTEDIVRLKQKTAMGTRMAPSYANIFMGKLKYDLLHQTKQKPTI